MEKPLKPDISSTFIAENSKSETLKLIKKSLHIYSTSEDVSSNVRW